MENTHCPKCNSEKWMVGVRIRTQESYSSPIIYTQEPKGDRFHYIRNEKNSELKASVCGHCGYTELQAQNHKALWAGWEKGYR